MSIVLTRDQVRRVDQLAVERYAMSGLVLMENAGRNAAEIIDREFGPGGRAVIFCGPGNNGGDGCVIARHLLNRGWNLRLVMTGTSDKRASDTATNLEILEAMEAEIILAEDADAQKQASSSIQRDEIVVDALLGTGVTGAVRSPTDQLIDAINARVKRATVAVDLPSGLDCDEGTVTNTAIKADLTVTFVAVKKGLEVADAGIYVGRVETADIGAPARLVEAIAAGRA